MGGEIEEKNRKGPGAIGRKKPQPTFPVCLSSRRRRTTNPSRPRNKERPDPQGRRRWRQFGARRGGSVAPCSSGRRRRSRRRDACSRQAGSCAPATSPARSPASDRRCRSDSSLSQAGSCATASSPARYPRDYRSRLPWNLRSSAGWRRFLPRGISWTSFTRKQHQMPLSWV